MPRALARPAQNVFSVLLLSAHTDWLGRNTSAFGSSERDPEGVQVGQMQLTAIFSCSSITSVFPAEASAGERRESAMVTLERSLCLADGNALQWHGQGWLHRARLHAHALRSLMGEGRLRRGSWYAALPVTLTMGMPLRAVTEANTTGCAEMQGTTAANNLTGEVWV